MYLCSRFRFSNAAWCDSAARLCSSDCLPALLAMTEKDTPVSMAALAAEAGVAAAGTAAVGFGLFNYNRANYLYDAEFRYERFTAGREYAVEQQNQYRNDLRTLSALTMVKNNQYAGLAALDMALCIALYCAGRLGLHGPSPPGWIMGLWLTNNACSFSFMGLAIFLALHASFRAQAASVNLLTRKIRVPVPSMRQLDKAGDGQNRSFPVSESLDLGLYRLLGVD
eukprot:Skav203630  [mRNA]  locus=scaffold1120:20553:24435:+ [translate_table: standard]